MTSPRARAEAAPAASAAGAPPASRTGAAAPPAASREAAGCGLLILRLGRASGARLGAALGALGMSPHEFAVLNGLAEAGPMSQGRLGRTLRVHPSNLVALIDGLEGEGLVVRRRDPGDRRRYLLGLTTAGRRRLDRALAAAEQVEDDLLGPLSAAERRQLHAYLERLAAHSCGGGKDSCRTGPRGSRAC